jgi:hypothetical protein
MGSTIAARAGSTKAVADDVRRGVVTAGGGGDHGAHGPDPSRLGAHRIARAVRARGHPGAGRMAGHHPAGMR